MVKIKTSFTLSETCSDLLKKLSEKKGVSMAALIELMVRDLSKKENVKLD